MQLKPAVFARVLWGLALTGCAETSVNAHLPNPPVFTATPKPGALLTPPPAVLDGVSLIGKVRLPSGIISNNGSTALGEQATGYGVLALATQTVAGVDVFLADAGGNAIPNLPTVKTDAQGAYQIAHVPTGFTFVVVAQIRNAAGATVQLKTLTKSGALGATADVDAASTLVTAEVVSGLPSGDLGEFNAGTFQVAHDATDRQLTAAELPDFSNSADVLAKMSVLVAQVGELKTSIDALKQDIQDIKQSLTEIQQELATQKASAAPTPSATPTPLPDSPTAAPTTLATATPPTVASATPTPTATVLASQAPTSGGVLGTTVALNPNALCTDAAGNVYIADTGNNRIRRLDPAGLLTTVAGTGAAGFAGDGGAATAAQLSSPQSVGFDGAGNLYIAEWNNERVRKVDVHGVISTIAGTGTSGKAGDNGPASAAQLAFPHGVTADSAGNVYIAEYSGGDIRKIDAQGQITTLANLPTLAGPSGVYADAAGNLFIVDQGHSLIRRVDAQTGAVTTVAGGGSGLGDGGAATSAGLSNPQSVCGDAAGNLYIADNGNRRVRKVDTAGIITTIAGGGTADAHAGGAATGVALQWPSGVAVDGQGNVFFADFNGGIVGKVSPQGVLAVVAGL